VLVDGLVEDVPFMFGQLWVPVFVPLVVDGVVVVVGDELGVGVGSAALTIATPPTPSRPMARSPVATRRLAAGSRRSGPLPINGSGGPAATWMVGMS